MGEKIGKVEMNMIKLEEIKDDILKGIKKELNTSNCFFSLDDECSEEMLCMDDGEYRGYVSSEVISCGIQNLEDDCSKEKVVALIVASLKDAFFAQKSLAEKLDIKYLYKNARFILVEKEGFLLHDSFYVGKFSDFVGLPVVLSEENGRYMANIISKKILDKAGITDYDQLLKDVFSKHEEKFPKYICSPINFGEKGDVPVYSLDFADEEITSRAHYLLHPDFYEETAKAVSSKEFYVVLINGVSYAVIPGERSDRLDYCALCILASAVQGIKADELLGGNDVIYVNKNGETKRVSKKGFLVD